MVPHWFWAMKQVAVVHNFVVFYHDDVCVCFFFERNTTCLCLVAKEDMRGAKYWKFNVISCSGALIYEFTYYMIIWDTDTGESAPLSDPQYGSNINLSSQRIKHICWWVLLYYLSICCCKVCVQTAVALRLASQSHRDELLTGVSMEFPIVFWH